MVLEVIHFKCECCHRSFIEKKDAEEHEKECYRQDYLARMH